MRYQNELYHHGIFGQKWGKRNGPPYPLKASAHSASEKKAGWRKSLNNTSDVDTKAKRSYTSDIKNKRTGLTSEQKKKLIKAGAAVAVAGLAAYGGYQLYKNGAFDSVISHGHKAADKFLAGSVDEIANSSIKSGFSEEAKNYIDSISDSLEKANPFKYDPNEPNTCVPSELAGFLRDNVPGYENAVAKGTGGKMISTYDVLHECFSGFVEEGKDRNFLEITNSIKFSKGADAAAEMILRRIKVEPGAEGLCAIPWKKRLPDGSIAGHVFGWKAIEGKNGLEIVFKDYSQGTAGKDINFYFNGIDPDQKLLIARLDGLTRNDEALKKYIKL